MNALNTTDLDLASEQARNPDAGDGMMQLNMDPVLLSATLAALTALLTESDGAPADGSSSFPL